MTGPRILTVQDAASTLLCSRRRVFELLADGTLERGPKYGKKTTVVAESVFDALEKAYDPVPEKRSRFRKPRTALSNAFDSFLTEARARPRAGAK